MTGLTEEPPVGFIAPSEDEITRCAYQFHLAEDCPEGRAIEHWFEAERQLTICALVDAVRLSNKSE